MIRYKYTCKPSGCFWRSVRPPCLLVWQEKCNIRAMERVSMALTFVLYAKEC